MHMDSLTYDAYKKAYSEDKDFKEVFQQLQIQIHVHNGDKTVNYHLQDKLLYRLDKLCIRKGERLYPIRKAHSSKVVGVTPPPPSST